MREDIIANILAWAEASEVQCVCAPFEADHQLVAMEADGLTQGSVTTDSDLFAIGAENVINQLIVGSTAGGCSLVVRSEVSEMDFIGYAPDDVTAFLHLLGLRLSAESARFWSETSEGPGVNVVRVHGGGETGIVCSD